MNELFDLTTVIFLVIAVFIVLRLRSVLGRRTGHEQPPSFDPFSTSEKSAKEVDNIINLPQRNGSPSKPIAVDIAKEMGEQYPEIADELPEILKSDPGFDPDHFMSGAHQAYDMIVNAFAQGDREMLASLLDTDVYESFETAISDRENNQQRMDFSLIRIKESQLKKAQISQGELRLFVDFESEISSVLYNKNNDVLEGDPSQITQVIDQWIFARSMISDDPNWKLVGTEG